MTVVLPDPSEVRLAIAAFASAQRASAAVMNSSVATVDVVAVVLDEVTVDVVESSPPHPAPRSASEPAATAAANAGFPLIARRLARL